MAASDLSPPQLIGGLVLGAAVLWLWLPQLSEVLALLARRAAPAAAPAGLPRLLILVPAHDEAALIGPCVESLLGMDYPAELRRVVVIADNCSDATASTARRLGAECLERTDLALPGKPRALAWALAQLMDDPWEACVIIDADTEVAPGLARGFAEVGPLGQIAAQGYFATLNEEDSWLTRLAGVLARCRYEVSYPVRTRAGLNCPLTGNGMCIGRGLLEPRGWQAFSLTENWELYAQFTTDGTPIRYARGALLHSLEVSSLNQGGTQRRRWLAGRMAVARNWVPRLLASSRVGLRQKLDAVAELTALPPVLHAGAAFVIAVIGVLALPSPHGAALAALAVGSLAGLTLAVLWVILHHPKPWAVLTAFLVLPVYLVWRSGVAVRTLLTLRDRTWRKTGRS